MKLHWLFNRYMKPADDGGTGGGGGGGAVDRGDDFAPSGSDAVDPPAKPVVPEPELNAEEQKLADELAAEGEAEGDKPAAETEGEGETKPKKVDSRIPLSRHKEILEKERTERKALEARLAQYQNGQQVADINAELTAAETKLVTMEQEYAKLVTDGDTAASVKLMSEIRRLERDVIEQKSDMKIAAAVATATESARYNITIERVEAAYPQLNPDHDDFDADLVSDVSDLKETYQRKGMTPTDALQKAVKRLIATESKKQEAAVEVTPQVKAADVAAERKREAVAKTLKAVNTQPPKVGTVGIDSDKDGGGIDARAVLKMSFKDFSALPDEQLSRMRGDTL